MPKVNDYKKKKNSESAVAGAPKRRPGRDPEETAESTAEPHVDPVVEAAGEAADAPKESINETVEAEAGPTFDPYDSSSYETAPEPAVEEKTHLEFPGSDLIRAKAPQVMDVADEVVDQWKKDGDFEGLPVGHPLAQIAVATGLRKAKEVEKKLEEKGVFAMAKMGLMYAEHELKKRGIIKK